MAMSIQNAGNRHTIACRDGEMRGICYLCNKTKIMLEINDKTNVINTLRLRQNCRHFSDNISNAFLECKYKNFA